jgi:hypothetical protein
VTAGDLFRDEPVQWGLRGDPWLWREMGERLASVAAPATPEALAVLVTETFEALAGIPITHPRNVYVDRYDHGGMSGGAVCPEFWRDTAIPLLQRRLAT